MHLWGLRMSHIPSYLWYQLEEQRTSSSLAHGLSPRLVHKARIPNESCAQYKQGCRDGGLQYLEVCTDQSSHWFLSQYVSVQQNSNLLCVLNMCEKVPWSKMGLISTLRGFGAILETRAIFAILETHAIFANLVLGFRYSVLVQEWWSSYLGEFRTNASDIAGRYLGKNWSRRFKKRNLQVITAKPAKLDLKRAKNFNKTIVNDYFDKWEELNEQYGVFPLSISGTWTRKGFKWEVGVRTVEKGTSISVIIATVIGLVVTILNLLLLLNVSLLLGNLLQQCLSYQMDLYLIFKSWYQTRVLVGTYWLWYSFSLNLSEHL